MFLISFTLCFAILALTFSHAVGTLKVTCIGDSITQGGACVPESYTDILAKKLGPSFSVLNAGVSGRTMLKNGYLDSSKRPFSYWDTDAWTKALNNDADIVTIMLGTNDAKYYNWEGVQQDTGDYYVLDYIDMINQLRQQSKPDTHFFIMIPPPVFQPYPFDMNGTIINNIFPTLIPNIATAVNRYQSSPENNQFIHVIDLHTPLVGHSELTCDGCHPTHDANVIFADIIAENIQSVLQEKAHRLYKNAQGMQQKSFREQQHKEHDRLKQKLQHKHEEKNMWTTLFQQYVAEPARHVYGMF